jgi:transposase
MGSENPKPRRKYNYLTPQRADMIRRLWDNGKGLSKEQLAAMFHVHWNTIHNVIIGKTYTRPVGRHNSSTAKLNPEQVKEIRRRADSGQEEIKQIASSMNLPYGMVWKVARRETYRSISDE